MTSFLRSAGGETSTGVQRRRRSESNAVKSEFRLPPTPPPPLARRRTTGCASRRGVAFVAEAEERLERQPIRRVSIPKLHILPHIDRDDDEPGCNSRWCERRGVAVTVVEAEEHERTTEAEEHERPSRRVSVPKLRLPRYRTLPPLEDRPAVCKYTAETGPPQRRSGGVQRRDTAVVSPDCLRRRF